MKVAIIDYGMGNLHSVAKAVEHVAQPLGGADVAVTADANTIHNADRVIFPGVGAIRDCMAEINRLSVGDIVREVIAEKPLLAICVGLQSLMEHSEENGGVDCLAVFKGKVRYFGDDLNEASAGEQDQRLKVPHMGWNTVTQNIDHPLWHKIEDESRFYFVHSYYVESDEPDKVAGLTHYGKPVVAALADKNLFAVQFHPEKSQPAGLTLVDNFLRWNGEC